MIVSDKIDAALYALRKITSARKYLRSFPHRWNKTSSIAILDHAFDEVLREARA